MAWRKRASRAGQEIAAGRWLLELRRGLETHISLTLFSMVLLAAIWGATWNAIKVEHVAARAAVGESVHELMDTYEAQVARNLGAIDQTLKVTAYAVGLKGYEGALPELQHQGLLPPGLLFAVSIVDQVGMVRASSPPAPPRSLAQEAYFPIQRSRTNDATYVSAQSAGQAGQPPSLQFIRRLTDDAGRFAGMVMVQVDPAYFTSGYERSRQGEHGMLGLFGGDGRLLALRVGERDGFGPGALSLAAVRAGTNWDGVARESTIRALSTAGLTLVTGLSVDEQMLTSTQHRRSSLWQAGIASALLILSVILGGLWSRQGAMARRSIQRAQETYAAAAEASLDAFFMLHSIRDQTGVVTDFRIATANSRAESMTGLHRKQLHGLKLSRALPSSWENGMFDKLVHATEGGHSYEEEWENDVPELRARWLHQQVVGVEDGVVAILRDISERKQTEARILHMAQHDALTMLPNRSLINERLKQALVLAGQQGDSVLVCFIDLDGFKLINDGLGHNAGDELLLETGERLRRCVRQHDTVGRFGGDEFVLVLPWGADRIDAAGALLDQIRASVTRPHTLGGQVVQVSCSIGVAAYPRDGESAAALLLNADAAMYRAKAAGKNNYQFYERDMTACVDETLALLDDLRHALENDQFRVLYQPKIDLLTGRLVGVEALVRWQHPQHGLIPPVRFIPLAEESGLIVELGAWVLGTACAQNRAWRDAGLPEITVAVNVSARQFDDSLLVARVARALADSRLAADALELELTESLIMRDTGQALAKMAELTAMGLSLSIDDFGVGYSSLSALKSYPVSRLKIDQCFVRELANNVRDQAITRAIIAMAHQLQLRVTAEGVETEQQREFLQVNGCDEMQGYLFSRPVEADIIAAMLAAR